MSLLEPTGFSVGGSARGVPGLIFNDLVGEKESLGTNPLLASAPRLSSSSFAGVPVGQNL